MIGFFLECVATECDHPIDNEYQPAIRLLLCASGQKSGIPRIAFAMNSRRTSPVGAITAPA
jgi:hypothetical protein